MEFQKPIHEPEFKHDCATCIFLQKIIREDKIYDLYVCPQGTGTLPTVLARYGNEASEYAAGISLYRLSDDNPLDVAIKDAFSRGKLRIIWNEV